ncbi:MAG: sterol desaturase family protein [Spirochaetales bacterium]|nr:sterol desaturase family protein [Spirochaetales bacterium]
MEPSNQVLAPFLFLLLSIAFILGEALLARRKGLKIHHPPETRANLSILAGNQIVRVLLTGWQLAILAFAARFALGPLPLDPLTFVACFIATDLFYYWQHRFLHTVPILWAFHQIHHSAEHMNFTTSFRLNWFTPLIGGFFFAPLALMGFPIFFILLSLGLNLAYQFFLHTTLIPPLGRLEGWLNTPSAHRVHHGSNDVYLDCNYGGVLMIWDRLFGTYVPETEKVRYGITSGPAGYNPLWLNVQGFRDYFRGHSSRG